MQLGKNKVNNIMDAEPDVVVSGNIGCIAQIKVHLDLQKQSLATMHLAQLLYQAYQLD